MAYPTARPRDPLLDDGMQAALERRGQELIGLALLALAVLLGVALGSFVTDDPGLMSSSDVPSQNLLGRGGASASGALMLVMGKASWAMPVFLAVWGLRMVLHRGGDRFFGRVLFAPLILPVAAVYASTLAPGADWNPKTGLGGILGDEVLKVALEALPLGLEPGLKLISVLSAVLLVALGFLVLGGTPDEASRVRTFLKDGFSALMMLARSGGGTLARTAPGLRGGLGMFGGGQPTASAFPDGVPAMQRGGGWTDVPPLATSMPPAPDPAVMPRRPATHDMRSPAAPPPAAPQGETEKKPGFLARVRARAQALDKRSMPEPELVEPEYPDLPPRETPVGAQVQERITRAIRDRERRARFEMPVGAHPHEPALSRPVTLFPDNELPEMPGPAVEPRRAAPSPQPMPEPAFVRSRPAAPEMAPPETYVLAPEQRQAPESLVQHPPRRVPQPSRQAQAEAQPTFGFEPERPRFESPPLSLLRNPSTVERHVLSDEALEENARMLESVLDDYGVKGEIVSVRPGPVVTMYELEPAPGLKASRVIGLADDIARSMSALSARVSTVPGRSVIGIELPNPNRETVVLREILSTRDFGDSTMRLPLALGKDIGGAPVVANLAKMPHLLIAGTTGSGKSVAINTMILSLLYKLSPEECRLIMIDPKMLELSVYDGIPHLLSPVVTDPKKAVVALKWVVGEMEDRYRKMSKMGVRNIEGYNGRVRETLDRGEMFRRTVQTGFDEATGEPVFETEEFEPKTLPYIVVIVDEMADLMMVAGKEIEACIQRLAQMARASGIHLIMATQRPSVDVITGTIKANFPTRISFQVTSKIDSRTILGEQGAEQLLGQGDMLYMAGGAKINRVHGPFVSDEEVEEIVSYLKSYGPPDYVSGVVEGVDDEKADGIDAVLGLGGNTDGDDALYDQAVAIVLKDRKCSTSYIQRKLAIGYNKAARLVEQMEDEGVVSPANHVGKREILVPEQ